MALLEPQTIGAIVDFIQFVGIVAVGAAQWLRKPGEDAQGELPKIRERLQAVEEAIKHSASNTDVANLRASVEVTKALVESMKDGQRRRDVQMDRIENFLLQKA